MAIAMQINDFDYLLPKELIARYPLERRSASRLLLVNRAQNSLQDQSFKHILDYFNPGDLFVFNNTKVIPARLFGQKQSGGKVEILVERVLDEHRVLAHIRSSKSPKVDAELLLENQLTANVLQRHDALFELEFNSDKTVFQWLDELGNIPLPPYLQRDAEVLDDDRYQTVYAKEQGAVAAPTAGLHFDDALLEKLKNHGINSAFLTLHVGAGTFQPVRVDNILEHKMHAEYIEVSQSICDQIIQTKKNGNKVIAIGTTSVRALESAATGDETIIKPFVGDTDIFIYPGYTFKIIDAMLTNFHLPKSTLLMLVSAFSGHDLMNSAYAHAVEQQYRFYSYGDAMLIGDF